MSPPSNAEPAAIPGAGYFVCVLTVRPHDGRVLYQVRYRSGPSPSSPSAERVFRTFDAEELFALIRVFSEKL
ncbi:hypothetical protein SRB5_47750 [Streptomyces sp. RB5]|uniref:Uncharacterized protein n=1 Tax=Streptomyces smaragdinus TaxID=2585196 RepID=A0A7K0CMA5_9ACTN|nr:hypothetical protein [Streptomyces smaragdinus]MQY14607.1 hypothetical protein [Streptomyces smaragdinus]